MRAVRTWVTSVVTMLVFGLMLGVFHVIGLVARLFGLRPFEWTMGALQRTLLWVFRISNISIDVEKHPTVAATDSLIFISNHQSMYDVPIFGGLLFDKYPKYVAKKELARWIPSISLNLRRGGNALIDRKDREQAIRAIKELGASITTRGTSVVLFPEGSRARDGKMRRFKAAGAVTLMEAAPTVAVVPTVIEGSWRVFKNNLLPIPWGERVRVRFCEPIERRSDEDLRGVLKQAEQTIRETLEEWRSESGTAGAAG